MEGLSKAQLKALREFEAWKRQHKMTLSHAIIEGFVSGDYAQRLVLGQQIKRELKEGIRSTKKAKGGKRKY